MNKKDEALRMATPLDEKFKAWVDLSFINKTADKYDIAYEFYMRGKAALSDAVTLPDGWVSVEDRLPDDDCKVIAPTWVTMSGKQMIEIIGYRGGSGEFDYPIKHWMPLPAAPTCEKES